MALIGLHWRAGRRLVAGDNQGRASGTHCICGLLRAPKRVRVHQLQRATGGCSEPAALRRLGG